MLQDCAVGPVPPVDVRGLQYDSRRLRPGEAFFAFPGARVDGHAFVPQALAAGAVAIVSERAAPSGLETRWVQVEHGRRALAHASLRFFNHPDRSLRVTAVTGTNGKTTTVHLLDALLRSAGHTTAALGTVEHRVGDEVERAVNTTPESLDIARHLARLRELGGTHATLEASSHALALERICGIAMHTAVFTNLTPEHLDFHRDMAEYAAAKRRLFEGVEAPPPRFAVANADDAVGRSLLQLGLSETVSYGRGAGASVRAGRVEPDPSGLRLAVDTPHGRLQAETTLAGAHNVDNLLAAIAAAQCLGLEAGTIEDGLRRVRAVPGRFESVREGQPFAVVVDYAHTEDALRRLLAAARQLAEEDGRPGRLLAVFGCGGDRDRAKRAPMGRAAGELSDLVVLTADNPRGEDPRRIAEETAQGLQGSSARWTTELDRAAAIASALNAAQAGDVVVIAGKGHETTQILADRTIPFDDRVEARAALRRMGYGRP